MNALLVTDNAQDEAILAHALRLAGMSVDTMAAWPDALEGWGQKPFEFLIVALRSPDLLHFVRRVRSTTIVPLILIAEALTEDQHVQLLEEGADWVIERPYNVRLLIGYTKAMLRRSTGVTIGSLPSLRYEEVQLDPSTRTVRCGKESPQRLSQLEFRLLHTLMVHRGQTLPTDTLVEHVWGYTGEGDRSLVRGLVNRLRMKIEPNPTNPKYILTVSRVGYSFGGSNDR